MSSVNSVELIIFSHMDLVGKREHLLSEFLISKVRLCLKAQLNFFDTILVLHVKSGMIEKCYNFRKSRGKLNEFIAASI